jgi:hypothetical protein
MERERERGKCNERRAGREEEEFKEEKRPSGAHR